MSKYQNRTQGPLKVELRSPDKYYPARDFKFMVRKDAAYTALVCTEADAILYAAAPDLLEALKKVVSVADRKTVEFDLAHAAISKAEGR